MERFAFQFFMQQEMIQIVSILIHKYNINAYIYPPPFSISTVYESSSERWSPVQSIEKILLSVLSMLAEPNVESGANIDACKLWRDNREQYEERIRADVRRSLGL